MEQVREIGRALIYGVIGGLAVAIVAVWAGSRDPLTILYVALAAFVVVAIAFEVLQQPWGRRWVPELPFDVRLTVARKNAKPRPPPKQGERGFLDFEKDWQRAIDDISAVMTKLTADQEKFNPRLVKQGEALAASKGTGIDTRIRRARESARAFSQHAESQERLERRLKASVRVMTENYMALLANPTTRANVSNPQVLSNLKASTIANSAGIDSYRTTMVAIRALSVEQEVNLATDRLIEVLTELKSDVDGVTKFCDEALVAIKQHAASPGAKPQRSKKRRR